MTPEQDQEYREEAERLALLPRADQRLLIEVHRKIAANPQCTKDERREAGERADALEKHLRRLNRKPRKS